MTDDQSKEQLGRDYMVAFRDRDEAWRDVHIAPDFVRHDPGLSRLLHGAFSDIELPVTHVLVQGDKVLVHLRMQGKHVGEFSGTPASGLRIDAAVMDLFRIADGKLAEHWALMDNLTMLKQIGAVPA